MKKNCLFAVTNALLVLAVGLLVGLFCQNIFTTGVGKGAFICLLVSLCIPAVIYFLGHKGGTPVVVMSVLLGVGELVIDTLAMINPNMEVKVFAVVQAILVALFLIGLLVFIGLSDKKEE